MQHSNNNWKRSQLGQLKMAFDLYVVKGKATFLFVAFDYNVGKFYSQGEISQTQTMSSTFWPVLHCPKHYIS